MKTVNLNVLASSIGRGQGRLFIDPSDVFCWTQNKPYSWYLVDLGSARQFIPNHYSFRYGSSGTVCFPRNWILQATNQLPSTDMVKREINEKIWTN